MLCCVLDCFEFGTGVSYDVKQYHKQGGRTGAL